MDLEALSKDPSKNTSITLSDVPECTTTTVAIECITKNTGLSGPAGAVKVVGETVSTIVVPEIVKGSTLNPHIGGPILLGDRN